MVLTVWPPARRMDADINQAIDALGNDLGNVGCFSCTIGLMHSVVPPVEVSHAVVQYQLPELGM